MRLSLQVWTRLKLQAPRGKANTDTHRKIALTKSVALSGLGTALPGEESHHFSQGPWRHRQRAARDSTKIGFHGTFGEHLPRYLLWDKSAINSSPDDEQLTAYQSGGTLKLDFIA